MICLGEKSIRCIDYLLAPLYTSIHHKQYDEVLKSWKHKIDLKCSLQPFPNVPGTTSAVAWLIREIKLDPTTAIISIKSFGTRTL